MVARSGDAKDPREKRLRVPLAPLAAGVERVSGDPAHYITRVHRLVAGDGFTAFDPEAGLEADAVVLSVDKGGLECRFEAPRAASALVRSGVTLVVAMTIGVFLAAYPAAVAWTLALWRFPEKCLLPRERLRRADRSPSWQRPWWTPALEWTN